MCVDNGSGDRQAMGEMMDLGDADGGSRLGWEWVVEVLGLKCSSKIVLLLIEQNWPLNGQFCEI